MKSKEISLNTEMTKHEINNFPGPANILTLKTNDIQQNPSTSNANSNTNAQIPCYRSDNNIDQNNPTNNTSTIEYRQIRNVNRLRTRNSNHLYEKPSNNNPNSQQSQYPQYPIKSYNIPQINSPFKQCRYQSNPMLNSSFSDQNYNSSESSFCDESASDSKLIAYNRISSQRMINFGENGNSTQPEYGYDNHVNVLQDYNNHSMIETNTQSYGNCPNDFNNPNNSSQIGLMTMYQTNENAASQQQNYSIDYQNYENK